MSHSLFLNTTNGFEIGILGEDSEWLDFVSSDERKSAQYIHRAILDTLGKNDIDFNSLVNVYVVGGPGSYTGLRLSSGIADILDWHNVNKVLFYLHKVPYATGIEQGIWICPAFKREYFLYEWEGKKNSHKLLSIDSLKEYMNSLGSDYEIYGQVAQIDFDREVKSTGDLIKSKSNILFPRLRKDFSESEIFYFRPLDQEFTKAGQA